jgi:isoleucyl-tRNA synthetase
VQKILGYFKGLDAYGSQEAARQLSEGGELTITVAGQQVTLLPKEIEVSATARPGFVTAEERGYIAALETTLTDELREEGMIRDLTHFIQDMRKKAGFNIDDRIGLALYTDVALAQVLQPRMEEIMQETLAGNVLVSISERDYPSFEIVYREKISPTSPKKLENYTIEVVLGKLIR